MDRNYIQNILNDTYLDVKTSYSDLCHILMNLVISVWPWLNLVDKVKKYKEVCRDIFIEHLTKKSYNEETGSAEGANVKFQIPTCL